MFVRFGAFSHILEIAARSVWVGLPTREKTYESQLTLVQRHFILIPLQSDRLRPHFDLAAVIILKSNKASDIQALSSWKWPVY